MSTPKPTPDEPLLKEPADFSLVLGGPVYQFFRRTHLAGDTLQLLTRRILVLALLAWVPLLLLSVAEGRAWGGSVELPFLLDVDLHVRLLLALREPAAVSVPAPALVFPAVLRGGARHEIGAVPLADRAATGGDNAAARGAADVDDDFAGGISRADAEDSVLTMCFDAQFTGEVELVN
jgi:hypothetical protein